MNASATLSKCPALLAACDLSLYERNIFRVIGLNIEASPREISRQAQKLQMLEEMDLSTSQQTTAYSPATSPSTDQIGEALARMKEPENRLIDEIFWFWPETPGGSTTDTALNAIQTGDSSSATRIWLEREATGSIAARHNLAIVHHLSAMEGTRQWLEGKNSGSGQSIKLFWQEASSRWQLLIDTDGMWDMLRQRVISLDDDALPPAFVRHLRTALPFALAKINAEAALLFSEQTAREWTAFHMSLIQTNRSEPYLAEDVCSLVLDPTRRRIEQDLASARQSATADPSQGAEIGIGLIERCLPLINTYDALLGNTSHHRTDLFDSVAATLLDLSISYCKKTADNHGLIEILQRALGFATGSLIRDRIQNNLSTGRLNLEREKWSPTLAALDTIVKSTVSPSLKISRITSEILSTLPDEMMKSSSSTTALNFLMDAVAAAFREIAVQAHNAKQDLASAEKAIQLAIRFVSDETLRNKFTVESHQIADTSGTALCHYCRKQQGAPDHKVDIPLFQISGHSEKGVSYHKNVVSISRCFSCFGNHRKHWKIMWWGALIGLLAGGFFAPVTIVLAVCATVLGLGLALAGLVSAKNANFGAIIGMGAVALTFVSLTIAGTPFAHYFLWNMLGGGVLGGMVTLVGAKIGFKKRKNYQEIALEHPTIATMQEFGWRPGESPSDPWK